MQWELRACRFSGCMGDLVITAKVAITQASGAFRTQREIIEYWKEAYTCP